MLGPDQLDPAADADRYSLASDIVVLVVLTSDEALLRTLREAVGSTRRLWHVPTADKVSDLLVAGEVGILLLDAEALQGPPEPFIVEIKRQFPDLVIVLAGDRTTETAHAGLISSGTIYRYIHKPLSPGRAKSFADAAVRKHDEQRRRGVRAPPSAPPPARPGWFLGGVLVACALAIALIYAVQRIDARRLAAPNADLPAALPVQPPLLARAAAALAANRLTEPAGDNALELFLLAQAKNPADPGARAGLAEVHERLCARAENALLEERFDEAAAAIEVARRAGVESGRIGLLSSQLVKARAQIGAARAQARQRQRAATPPPARDPNPAAPDAAAPDTAAAAATH